MRRKPLSKPVKKSLGWLSLCLFILSLPLSAPFRLGASSWDECHYQARVKILTEDQIVLLLEKHIGGDGMGGDPGPKYCKSYLGEVKLAKSKVKQDLKLAKEGKGVRVSRMSYSAMGEDGPVGGVSWRLAQDSVSQEP